MRFRVFWVLVLALLMVSCGDGLTEKVIESYGDGQPALVYVYDRNGQWIKQIEYYEGGALKMEGAIKNGQREGEWKSYFEDGKMQSSGFFHEDKRTGKALIYHENGHLYIEGNYRDGKKIGIWNYYDEQGYPTGTKDLGE